MLKWLSVIRQQFIELVVEVGKRVRTPFRVFEGIHAVLFSGFDMALSDVLG